MCKLSILNPDKVQSAEVRGTKSSFPILITKICVLHGTPQPGRVNVEGGLLDEISARVGSSNHFFAARIASKTFPV